MIFPYTCSPYYLIKLKNNGRFTTSGYWREDNQIKFYLYEGEVGLQKNFIKNIKTKNISRKNIPSIKTPKPVSIQIESKTQNNEHQTQLMKEFFIIKKKFKKIDYMDNQELYQFSQDLTTYRNKLIKSRSGHFYSKQFVELHSMGDKVERLTKARIQ
ncbi:putative DUF5667 domain-containing protein [Candidatus Magnetomoraceae bacterium gMMP-15]